MAKEARAANVKADLEQLAKLRRSINISWN